MRPVPYNITDIARRSGISKSTVSRYINGQRDLVSKKTQEKIRQVIEELDFHPNLIAVSLAKQEMRQIGVVMADISNPFSAIAMQGIFDACAERNFSVSFANSNGDPQRERENIQNFFSFNIDRIIVNTCGGNEDYLDRLDPTKTVILDRPLSHNRFFTVTSDNQASTFAAIRHLQTNGYDTVAFLTPSIHSVTTRRIRYQGYLQAVEDQESLLISYDSQAEADRKLAQVFNQHPHLGIFTVNGEALKTLLRFTHNQKIAIGSDVGVVSFEDWDWMEFTTPTITAVRQDSYGMGHIASCHLLDESLMDGSSPQLVTMSSELVLRDSVSHHNNTL